MFHEFATECLMAIQASGLYLLKGRDDFVSVFFVCRMLKSMGSLMRLAIECFELGHL